MSKELERPLQAILDHSPSVAYLKDLQGRYLFVNRRFAESVGRASADILGKTAADIWPRAIADRFADDDREVVATRAPLVRELDLPDADGRFREHYALKFPILDGDGNVVAIGGINVDISDRRQAEDALRASEARFRDFAEVASDWLWEMGPDLRFTYISERIRELSGVAPEHFIGKTREEIGVPKEEEKEEWRRHLDDLKARRPFRDVTYRRRDPDGGFRYARVSGKPIVGPDGQFLGYRGVATDVTAEMEARRALAHSERLARGVIETALDPFIRMDQDGRIVEWNSQAEKVFGWRRDEAVGRTLAATLVPPDQRDAHAAGLRRFLETGESRILGRRLHMTARHKDGHSIPVELAVTAYRVDGTYVFNGFVRDLTHELATQAQLRQAQKMEAVGRLAGGIAHDFNNLLQVILGNAEMALDEAGETPPLRQQLEMIRRSSERGADLVRRMLAFSRQQTLQPEVFDLHRLVVGMQDMLARALGETIEVRVASDGGPHYVEADPAQLEAALLNLALNARDAMPGGGALLIWTRTVDVDDAFAQANDGARPGRYAMVSVADTGQGMPPEVRARAFEPFFTTKEVGKGSGLGLSMVYGFVKQSDGYVRIDSAPGAGTTVEIYLPSAAPAT